MAERFILMENIKDPNDYNIFDRKNDKSYTKMEITGLLNELSEKLEYETKLHNQYMEEALSMDKKLQECKEKMAELEEYKTEYELLNKFVNENQSIKEIMEMKRKLNKYEQDEFERTQGRGW